MNSLACDSVLVTLDGSIRYCSLLEDDGCSFDIKLIHNWRRFVVTCCSTDQEALTRIPGMAGGRKPSDYPFTATTYLAAILAEGLLMF